MPIKLKISEIISSSTDGYDNLMLELIDNLDLLKESYPGYSYEIESDIYKNYIRVKSVNLMEHTN
jgi:hypothetical protein